MSVYVRCGQNWGRGVYEGEQGPRKTVLVREVGGEEASLRCLVSWQPESLCTEADLKQVYQKNAISVNGYNFGSTQSSDGFTFYSGLVFIMLLSFHPAIEASLLVGLSSPRGCTQPSAATSCCLGAYPASTSGTEITSPPTWVEIGLYTVISLFSLRLSGKT